MSRGIETSTKRFPILLDTILNMKSKSTTEVRVIYILNTGEVFVSTVKKDRNDYIFSTGSDAGTQRPDILDIQKLNLNLGVTDVVAYSEISKPVCKMKFTPMPDTSRIYAELASKNRLLIYGMMYEGVPSFGIYQVIYTDTDVKFELTYTDSIYAVSDISIADGKFFVLPRKMLGMVAIIDAPTLPGERDHRLIPMITMVGQGVPQMEHIQVAGSVLCEWKWATWNDETIPSLALWKNMETENKWKVVVLEFTEPAWIRSVAFNTSGLRLGMAMMIGNQLIASIWELDRDGTLEQTNYKCDGIGDLLSIQWLKWKDLSESFYVIGTLSVMEISKSKGSIMFWPQGDLPMVVFNDVAAPMARFYVNTNGELHVINSDDLDRDVVTKDAQACRYGHITVIKATVTGDREVMSGLHLHRCHNCRSPLISPLYSVSADKKISAYYCSRKCQEEHWPLWVGAHNDAMFKIDDL